MRDALARDSTTNLATAGTARAGPIVEESWWMGKDRAAFNAEVARRFVVNREEPSVGLGAWPMVGRERRSMIARRAAAARWSEYSE